MTVMPDKSVNIELSVEEPAWKELWNTQLIEQALNAAGSCMPDNHPFHIISNNYEISITLCNDDFIQNINKEWRDKDKATNVLSFPQFEDIESEAAMFPEGVAPPIGDIFIAYETVEREAKEQEKSFNDHSVHMLIHGFLHLLGYDHIDDEEAEIMESLEVHILRSLNIDNPYKTMYKNKSDKLN